MPAWLWCGLAFVAGVAVGITLWSLLVAAADAHVDTGEWP